MTPLKKLNPRERSFALAYTSNGRNATRAYMSVYPRAQANTAATGGSIMLRKPNVAAFVHELSEAAFAREHMTAQETLALVARIARVDPADLLWRTGELDSNGEATVPGSIKPMEQMPVSVRTCIKGWKFDILGRPEFQFCDRNQALTVLAKHHKLISDKTEIGVDQQFGDLLKAAIKNLEGGK